MILESRERLRTSLHIHVLYMSQSNKSQVMMINDCISALNYSARHNAWVTIPSQRGDTKANATREAHRNWKGKNRPPQDAYRNLMNPSLSKKIDPLLKRLPNYP